MVVTLRAHALSHPLLLLLVSVAAFALLDPVLRRLPAMRPGTSRERILATYVFVLLYLATAIVYAAIPAYFDHVEPAVTAVSWLVMRGQPAYPDQTSAGMYGLPYGPMLFLLNGFAMRLFGPSIIASKVAGAGAAITALFVLGLALRRSGGEWQRAIRWAALVLLMFGVTSVWARAEPLLLLCSSLAVLSLTVSASLSALLIGIALGVGVNLKVSAVIYIFPALALLWRKHGPVKFAAAAAIATLIAAMPFVALPNVSLPGYLSWVQSATGQGVRLSALPTAIEWMIVLIIPMLVMVRPDTTRREIPDIGLFRALVIASMLVSLPLASKYGTGNYHFLPFVPSIFFASGAHARKAPALLARAMLASFVFVAALQVPPWVTATTSLPARVIISELKQIERDHSGTMAMGYSPNYRLSFFRPVLVFAGQPYALDGASLMDWHWSGRPFPAAAIAALRACAVDAWIIPVGAPPFVLPNAYPVSGDVFPDEFRRAFEDTYVLERSGQWFDVWRCRR